MTQVAWAAIGLLAATFMGTLFNLGNKTDALGASLDSRFDTLSTQLKTHIQHHTG